jgi:serpin B
MVLLFGYFAEAQNPVVKSINNFGFETYRQLPQNKNIFISPFSTNIALSIALSGAEGDTKSIMAEIMKIDSLKEFLNGYKNIETKIFSNKNTLLKSANSLWYQNDFKIENAYLSYIKDNFNAPAEKVDFIEENSRENARISINKWVENQTDNQIKDLITPNSLTPETRLIITNAIYFKANWEKAFEEQKTKKEVFFSDSLNTDSCDFMHANRTIKYFDNTEYQSIELSYKENSVSMIIFLPKEISGLEKLEASLNNATIEDFYAKSTRENTNISFPKFKMDYDIELSEVLKKMGMENAFSKEANFSKINKDKKVHLDKVIHKTFISVDENGTEAAAATAVVMQRTTSVSSLDPKIFNANHPFVFAIVDNSTHAILFLGRLAQP